MSSTENSMFNFQKNAKGLVLFDKICEKIEVAEKDYFGLRYIDEKDGQVLYMVFLFFVCFFNPFTPGNEPKEISYHSVIAFPYRQMTRSKKIDIEDGLKCKTANSYLKFPKYVSHEVPRNLIEKILNIALICESKPVTGNL